MEHCQLTGTLPGLEEFVHKEEEPMGVFSILASYLTAPVIPKRRTRLSVTDADCMNFRVFLGNTSRAVYADSDIGFVVCLRLDKGIEPRPVLRTGVVDIVAVPE